MGSPGPRTIAKDWLGLDESGTFELTELGAALRINIGSYVFLWARIVRMKACPATLVTAIRWRPSPRKWKRSSATPSSASSPIRAIAGTMGRPTTSSGCSRQIRSARCPRRSGTSCVALRRRAGHRPSQIRTSYGPRLSLVPTRRRHQCGPGCRGLQPPPPHPLAGALAVPNPCPADRSRLHLMPKLKSTFLTDDYDDRDVASTGSSGHSRSSGAAATAAFAAGSA